MRELKPLNFQKWIDEHRHLLKPPVCNKLVFEEAEFIVMVVGGPNTRKDYHYDEGEEFFYQIEGRMILKIMQDGQLKDIPLEAGEIFLLPARVPHSPQRFENSVGLVIERKRLAGEKDGFMWFCDTCSNLLYEEYFTLNDIEKDLPQVFDHFYSSLEHRTCSDCRAVMEPPS